MKTKQNTRLRTAISAAGYFELELLEISNTNSHLLNGYCCGVPLEIRSTKTTGCPSCSTAFRLCLKEYSAVELGTTSISTGCSFGNSSTGILGGSSFVLSDPGRGAIVLPFTFRWTGTFYMRRAAIYDKANGTCQKPESFVITTACMWVFKEIFYIQL
uniref:Notch ligand N-terminal domain-containing protein n=1 Tax=Glossina palpalis gambiensis TaxID=67801 RepID=A0A1B0B2Q2_9MUSC